MSTSARPRDRREVKQALALAVNDLERTWLYWKALIGEKQDEIARRMATDDLDDLLVSIAAPANAPKQAKLPAAVRQELLGVLEARRQQAQEKAEVAARAAGQSAPDPDTVYRDLLQFIQDELDGKMEQNGWARVWYEGQLTAFDHRSVTQTTADADYLVAQGTSSGVSKRQQVVVGVVGLGTVVVLLVIVWNLLWTSESPAAIAATSLQVGVEKVNSWDVQTAAIGAVTAPATLSGVGRYPTVLCMNDAQQEALRPGTTVVLTGTDAVRVYRVNAAAPSPKGDLLAAMCGSGAPTVVHGATLIETRTHRSLPPQTVADVLVWGPDTNPSAIPADRMQIDLTVNEADGAQGTLILADGSRWSPTKSTPGAGEVQLTYLVPYLETFQMAGWELGAPSGDLPALATVNVPAPTSRDTLLRQVMTVTDTTAGIARKNGAPTLALTLTVSLSAESAPLTLLADDLRVWQGNTKLATTTWTPSALTPGKSTTLTISIPLQVVRSPIEVALGPWRQRYSWTEGGR